MVLQTVTPIDTTGIDPETLAKARKLAPKVGSAEKKQNTPGQETQKPSQQSGQTQSIKEQFNKIPIIGPMLYKLLHSILKLFGIDLEKIGQGGGMSLQDAIAQAPDWAKNGLKDVLKGVEYIQQNPLKFREGLRMMSGGVKELKTSAKKNGASKDTINALGKMEGAMDRLAKAGPFSAISALKGVASAAKDLQQAFKDDPTLQQDTSRGIGLNLNKTAVGDFGEQNFDAIGKEIDAITSSADERRTFSEKAHEEGEQGEIDKQSKKDLKAGLNALNAAEKGTDEVGVAQDKIGEALGNLARSFGDEEKGQDFLESAVGKLSESAKSGKSIDYTFKAISDNFDDMKKTETGAEPKNQETRDFSKAVKDAAKGFKGKTSGAVNEGNDTKTADTGGGTDKSAGGGFAKS